MRSQTVKNQRRKNWFAFVFTEKTLFLTKKVKKWTSKRHFNHFSLNLAHFLRNRAEKFEKVLNSCYNIYVRKRKRPFLKNKKKNTSRVRHTDENGVNLMTEREFLVAVIESEMNEDVIDHAKAALEKLDAQNAKRREAKAKKDDATMAFIQRFAESLDDTPKTATDLVPCFLDLERPDGKDWNVQYVSYLGRAAVEAGLAESCEVKVPKKGTQKGYKAVAVDKTF